MSCTNGCKNEIHSGDVGTTFQIQILDEDCSPYPLNDASLIQFKFQKPNATSITRTAIFTTDGTDGKVQYSTVSGDLDVAGLWKYQVYIEKSGINKYSDIADFRVHPNLPL